MSTPALNSRRRFDATAEEYHRYRPSYPEALVDWIVATTGLAPRSLLVDVGCGTGIATRLFAKRGFDAVGVDPSEEMLRFARSAGLASYVRAQAEATGLAAGRVHVVLAAQCFHWFDVAPTLREFRRILRPEGWCAVFWNLRAATPVMDAYDGLLRMGTSEYDVMARQDATAGSLREIAGMRTWREGDFSNSQFLDLEGLVGRAYSSSCVRHGVSDPAAFERALASLFDRHQQDGRIELQYRTVGYCWRPDTAFLY